VQLVVPASTFIQFFPHVYFSFYTVTGADTLQTLEAVVDAYVATMADNPGPVEVIYNLGDTRMQQYGNALASLPKFQSLVFVNTVSVLDSVRANTRVYFAAMSANFFIPALFARYNPSIDVQYVLVPDANEQDAFTAQVVAAATAAGVGVIPQSNLNTPAAQAQMEAATQLWVCALPSQQQAIVDTIPVTFNNYVIFIRYGPVSNAVLNPLAAHCSLVATNSPPVSLSLLNNVNAWFNAVRALQPTFSLTPYPADSALYTLCATLSQWNTQWCVSDVVRRGSFDITSIYYVQQNHPVV
jgi:hypothetical protein